MNRILHIRMKKKKKKKPSKQGKQVCLSEGQIKTILDEARGEGEHCDAAEDFIKDIDDKVKKPLSKKVKKSFTDRWL